MVFEPTEGNFPETETILQQDAIQHLWQKKQV
jgi:hypothetical protein